MAVVLGYWNIRALAQSIRLLLKYTGTNFEEVRYNLDDPNNEWKSVKNTLGLDFPNLPYLIDGDVKMTQSNAILRYLATKHDMCGKSETEIIRVNMIEHEALDLRMGFTRLCFNPNLESLKKDYLTNTKVKMERFNKFLGCNKWFAGENISFVDFTMYEFLDEHRLFDSDLFNGLDNLKAFFDRFESLPAIKEYMASDQFIRSPVNAKFATWSG